MTAVPSPRRGASTLRRRELLARGGAVLTFGLLAACGGGGPSTKTTPLHFNIKADDLINPNRDGDASPVVVRIYELKNNTTFEQLDFFDLLDNDQQKLGQDLIAKRELELKPNDEIQFDRDTPIETRFIGVIVGFREIETAKWRTVTVVAPERKNIITVKITAQSITTEFLKQSSGFF